MSEPRQGRMQLESAEELEQQIVRNLGGLNERVARIIADTGGVELPSYLVLGGAGVGKSTLITALAGGRLQAVENDLGVLVLNGALNRDVVIGHRLVDGTSMPGAYYDRQRGVVLWDCPGFGDPRGVLREILNAACIARILQVSARIKLVIVLSEDDVLHPRGGNTRLLFEQLVSIFPDVQQVNAITSLVITHHVERRRPVQALRNLLDDRVALSEEGKSILRHILEHENKIAYVAKPANAGEYQLNQQAIWTSIGAANDARQVRTAFSLPLEALRHLETIVASLNEEITEQLRTQQRSIEQAFDTAVLNFSGNSDGLRQRLHEFSGSFADMVRASGQDLLSRDDVRVFERIPGLSQDIRVSLSRKMDQIETLKQIAGQLARGLRFSVRDWLSALQNTQSALERMGAALERPVRVVQIPVRGSFAAPGARGNIEHREFFRLPNGSEKVTVTLLPALLTLMYTPRDEILASVPREQYTIQQAGTYLGTILEGELRQPIAYEQQRMTVTPVEHTLNVVRRTVSLQVVREYLRTDGSRYTKEDRVDGHPVVCSHDHYVHDDTRHESKEFVNCTAAYNSTQLNLGVHAYKNHSHSRVDGSREETKTVRTSAVDFRFCTRVTYVRADSTHFVTSENSGEEVCAISEETREIVKEKQGVSRPAGSDTTHRRSGAWGQVRHTDVHYYAEDYLVTVYDIQQRKVARRADGNLLVVEDWKSSGKTRTEEQRTRGRYEVDCETKSRLFG